MLGVSLSYSLHPLTLSCIQAMCVLCLPLHRPEFTSPTEVAPGIFIGNREDAQAPTRLKSLNIRFILNAAAQLPNFLEDDPHFRYLKLDIYDKESENITPHFSKAIAFIHRAQQKGQGCMIHCIAGVSRSVALTIAYLMHKKRERLLTVMKRVSGR